MGLRLSPDKTLITHIDEGLDFLGWRIQRHRKRGTTRHYVYTYPAKKALRGRHGEGEDAVPTGRHEPTAGCPAPPAQPGAAGLVRATSGPGCPRATFDYLATTCGYGSGDGCGANTAGPPGRTPPPVLPRRWWPAGHDRVLFNPATVGTTRYRYRGSVIPSPWPTTRATTTRT